MFPKKRPPPPLAHNTDVRNQALELLLVTAAVNLVFQLDHYEVL